MNKQKQAAFTLVEIAIILVIVGLLVGGMLKGHEMITNSKLKRIERDNAGIAAAVITYQDRYRQLPGDDEFADQRFEIYTDGVNDPAAIDINGDGDGRLGGNWIGVANSETRNVWKHLRAAGLIPGGGDDDTQPINAYGGNIGLRDGSLLISGQVIVTGSIEGSIAAIIENRLDDGAPDTGRIQSDVSAALMDGILPSTAGANYIDTARYFMAFRM